MRRSGPAFDGWNPTKKVVNGTVQQAGVVAFCKTKRSVATYAAFYEMYPACLVLDKHVVVHAGDRFGVIVGVSRGVYSFALYDFTDNTDDYPTARCAKGTTCRNSTAEVITEAPGGGPDAGNGVADTGTVMYTYAAAAPSTQKFNATPLGKLPGLTKITMSPKGYPDLITVSKIRQGPNGLTDFKTFWK